MLKKLLLLFVATQMSVGFVQPFIIANFTKGKMVVQIGDRKIEIKSGSAHEAKCIATFEDPSINEFAVIFPHKKKGFRFKNIDNSDPENEMYIFTEYGDGLISYEIK